MFASRTDSTAPSAELVLGECHIKVVPARYRLTSLLQYFNKSKVQLHKVEAKHP